MQDRDSRAKLIHRYLDDSLGAAEEAEFIASLENSADTRRQFVEEAFLNHDLREAMREADIRSFIVSGEDEASLEPADKLRSIPLGRGYSIALRVGLAAAVLIAVALSIPRVVSDNAAPDKVALDEAAIADQPATDVDKAEFAESVGTVVQQRDCKWVEGSTSWRNGDLLRPKTLLSLQSGAASVMSMDSARVMIAGFLAFDVMASS